MLPRTTFSVVFFCKKTKVTKKSKAPIYARITTTGQSTEIYTQCQIEPERWNQRLERSLYKDEVDQQINRIIASYRASILAAYDRLIQENRTPTCFAVKQLLGSASSSRMLLAEFGKYCEKRQQEVGTRITQLTANKYHRLLRYMTEYIRQVYGKEDLPLETVDYAYVDGLNTYMQTGAADESGTGSAAKATDAQREAGPHPGCLLLLRADGTGLHGCRPPAAGTLHDGRGGTAVDP